MYLFTLEGRFPYQVEHSLNKSLWSTLMLVLGSVRCLTILHLIRMWSWRVDMLFSAVSDPDLDFVVFDGCSLKLELLTSRSRSRTNTRVLRVGSTCLHLAISQNTKVCLGRLILIHIFRLIIKFVASSGFLQSTCPRFGWFGSRSWEVWSWSSRFETSNNSRCTSKRFWHKWCVTPVAL